MSGGSQDLFGRARAALVPPQGARERVAAALAAAALVPAQGPAPTAPPAASAAPGSVAATGAAASAAVKIGGGVLALALVVGAAWFASRGGPSAPAAQTSEAQPAETAVAAASADPIPTAAPSVEPSSADAPPVAASSAPAQRAPASSASGAGDSLAEELALIKRAQASMRSGDAAGALTLLDQHQHRFPRGALGPERSALRIQALCALGRGAEARTLFQRLEAASPSSPHLGSLKRSCPALGP
jgi:hypothetical protein